LETANLASGVANATVTIAIPWLVLQETGSPLAAGVVVGLSSVLGGVAAPIVGTVIDRIGRRVVSVASDVLSAISVAAIPIVALFTELTFIWILMLAALGAIFDPAGYTARKTLIVDVARAARMGLPKLNGIHEGLFTVGWTLGPVLAAGLIASIGAINVFWIPCVLFLIAALSVAFMRVSEAGEHDREEPFWSSAGRGIRILWTDRPLRAVTIAVMVLAAVYLPTESIVLPVHFQELELPIGLGIVITALAGGAMIGAFAYGWLATRLKPYALARLVLLGTMASIIPLALLPALPIMAVAAFILGLSWGPMTPLLNTIVQRRVPAEAQGRVFGAQMALFYAGPPLAMLITGAVVDALGVRIAYLGIAIVLVLSCAVVLFVPSIRKIDE
jgi:MFS family permease